MSQRLTKKLMRQTSRLSRKDKLELAAHLFGCELETDNFGQYLVYTGLTYDEEKKKVRALSQKDYDDM